MRHGVEVPGRDVRPRYAGSINDTRASESGRRLNVRLIVAAIAAICAITFVLQNNDRVRLRFLMIDVTTRLWVGLVVSLVLGVVLGQAAGALRRRRND